MGGLLSLMVMFQVSILRILLGHAWLPDLSTGHLVNVLLAIVSLERSLLLVTLGHHRVDHIRLMDLFFILRRLTHYFFLTGDESLVFRLTHALQAIHLLLLLQHLLVHEHLKILLVLLLLLFIILLGEEIVLLNHLLVGCHHFGVVALKELRFGILALLNNPWLPHWLLCRASLELIWILGATFTWWLKAINDIRFRWLSSILLLYGKIDMVNKSLVCL